MNKKNEMIKQELSEVAEMEEQQFFEDVRLILNKLENKLIAVPAQ